LATDASGQAQGCALTTLEEWQRNPTASCSVIEDKCWLNKNRRTHINLGELEAVSNGFKLLRGYAKPGDRVLLIIDSTVVAGWLNRTLNDQKVNVGGLYEILVSRRLYILSEVMEDYQVTVEWVPTDRNPADCLTRYPVDWDRPVEQPISCAITTDRFLEEVIEGQREPEVVAEVQKLDMNGLLYLIDEVAYKRNEDGTLSIIIPDNMVTECIKRVHNDLAHPGWKPTYAKYRQQFFNRSKGVVSKVHEVVQQCRICQIKNAKTNNRTGPNYHSERVFPCHEVFVDTVQVSSAVSTLPHLLIVYIDNFSKFVEVYATTNKRAETVVRCLDDLVARYGAPRIIRADNGSEYANEVVQDFLTARGCRLHLGATRNPQAQGSFERVHRTLLTIIRSLLLESNQHWTEVLYQALDAYRSRPHSSLGMR
jgi:transposase InsO family protein